LLSEAHEALDNADSAFLYFRKYMEEKDIVMSDQFKGRLFAFKHSSRIQMLEQEKLMSEQKLRANKMVRNILIGGIVLLILLGWILVWNISLKRKNEKLTHERAESEWKRRAGELEMQALRAQMNPHFIFNALSSVNRFILKNDPDKASDYLTRFSRLIRLVLVNSQRDLIQLEEEIEMLQLYLQIEQLRFKNAFEYEIVLADDIDASVIFVPPLLLQPFCENAIWHGLMHQTTPGKLRVEFSMKGDVVHCTITDNGIGIKKAQELASTSPEKIKSLGLRLTRDRLALFNQGNAMHTSYEIEDIVHEDGSVQGTRVKLQIRHQSVYNPVKTAPV
jgi:Putative regulator of cell autolysis